MLVIGQQRRDDQLLSTPIAVVAAVEWPRHRTPSHGTIRGFPVRKEL